MRLGQLLEQRQTQRVETGEDDGVADCLGPEPVQRLPPQRRGGGERTDQRRAEADRGSDLKGQRRGGAAAQGQRGRIPYVKIEHPVEHATHGLATPAGAQRGARQRPADHDHRHRDGQPNGVRLQSLRPPVTQQRG